MPPEVRRAYDRVMAQLPDADRNGVPDILEAPIDTSYAAFTSIVVNGRRYETVGAADRGCAPDDRALVAPRRSSDAPFIRPTGSWVSRP
jgi:hypothetical protein